MTLSGEPSAGTFVSMNTITYSEIQSSTLMKRNTYLTLFALLLALPLLAQPVKKVQIISASEVPVIVMQRFVDNYGNVGDGTWSVSFNVVSDGARTTAQPVNYTFRKGNGRDKIEVRFTPDGRVEGAKGIEKTAGPSR